MSILCKPLLREQREYAFRVNASLALESLREILEHPALDLSPAQREQHERNAAALAESLGEVDPEGESFGVWCEDDLETAPF